MNIMTKYGRIYIIRNIVNDKVYIGQTRMSVRLRFQDHLSSARKGGDHVIGKAIRKYGEDKFYVELLEECLADELNEREKYWISFHKANKSGYGYNMSSGGNATYQAKNIDENAVIRHFKAGIPAFKIASLLHVGVPRVTAILRKHDISYGIVLQKIPMSEKERIVEAYNKGFGTMEICRSFGRNKSSVRKILREFNIRLRSKQETKNMRREISLSDLPGTPREYCDRLVND